MATRIPIYILLDCSQGATAQSLAVLRAIHSELMNDPQAVESVWLSVIRFGESAEQLSPLQELCSFTLPELTEFPTNARHLGKAIHVLETAIHAEIHPIPIDEHGRFFVDKVKYPLNRDFPPFIIVILNGILTDLPASQNAVKSLYESTQFVHLGIFCDHKIDLHHPSGSQFVVYSPQIRWSMVFKFGAIYEDIYDDFWFASVTAQKNHPRYQIISEQKQTNQYTKQTMSFRRLPVYILADCSGSMTGDPIESVKAGIRLLHSELMNDPSAVENAYLSVITFGSSAKQVVPLCDLASFNPPELVASGTTALGEALKLLIDCLHNEVKQNSDEVKGDWKPLVFLLTDGAPTDNWQQYADELKAKRPGNIIAVACGDGADSSILKSIAEKVLVMKTMSPNDFSKFFIWVTNSIKQTSIKCGASPDAAAAGVALPPPPPGIVIIP